MRTADGIEARRIDARDFLLEASAELASSLDVEATLARLAGLAVPRLADACLVRIVDADGQTAEAGIAHRDPACVAIMRDGMRSFPSPAGADWASAGGTDGFLPSTAFVRLLFQAAGKDASGGVDEQDPLVDWTGDISRFNALDPGLLRFFRFQVEFELDAQGTGPSSATEAVSLDFLRIPFVF